MRMTVPSTITDQVIALIKTKLNPSAKPQYVTITPGPGCMPSDCFANVQKRIAKEGGGIQFGWAVWEWPGVYLEAEHHAVYVPPDSTSFIDITPCTERSSRRLFVPHDTATWDFENEGVLRDNLRFALIDDPLVDDLFKAAARRVAFMNELPGVGMIKIHASEDKTLQKLVNRVARASEALAEKYDPSYRRS
jgi:hypothetical protein